SLKAIFVLFLLASLPMCKGCGEEKTINMLEIVPQDAAFVAYLPSLKDALRDTTAYIETLAAPTGIDVIGKLRQGLKTRLGSDPLERETLIASGVDFEKGVVLFSLAKADAALMGVAVRDKTSFNKALKGYLARMDGADSVEIRDVAGFKVYLAGRPFGTEVVPVLHWTVFNGIALLATDESKAAFEEHLTFLSKQKQAEAVPAHILLDPVYKEMSARIKTSQGKGFSIFIRGSAAADKFNAGEGRDFSKGAMTHATIGIEGFAIETFIHTAQSLEKALGKKAPIELAKQIDNDAIFLILTQSATPEAYTALKAHPVAKDLARRMLGPLGQAAGIDPEKDVLPLLTGPMALSVHLGGIDKSLARFAKNKSFRSLLNIIHIVATAKISDPKAMLKTLRASKESLTTRKVAIEESEIVV
ncbi:hypothetical protein KAI87_02400, partial [Myxococcota bacterium]|nr:hypothetical protein [Myxococcota bacterium]